VFKLQYLGGAEEHGHGHNLIILFLELGQYKSLSQAFGEDYVATGALPQGRYQTLLVLVEEA